MKKILSLLILGFMIFGFSGVVSAVQDCGNGVIDFELGEECDFADGTWPISVGYGPEFIDDCSSSCIIKQIPNPEGSCGDLVLNDPEECDGEAYCFEDCTMDDEAPVITNITQNPVFPTCSEDVIICAEITDASEIAEVMLRSEKNGYLSSEEFMNYEGGDTYCLTFSALSEMPRDEDTISYHIRAIDEFGNFDWVPNNFGESFTYDCVAPTAVITGDLTCNEGTTIDLSGADSWDTVTPFEDLVFSWIGVTTSNGEDATINCIDDGQIDVTLTVTDNVLNTSSITEAIIVSNVNPVANTNGDYTGNEGSAVQLEGSYTDAGVLDVNSTFAWDLNDDGLYDDSTLEDPTFECLEDGFFYVSLQVTDKDGGVDTSDAKIICENVAPTIDTIEVIPDSINEEDSTTFTATVSDVGTDDSTLSYLINWGDGTSDSTGTTTGIISETHQYMDDDLDNQYTITLTVTDTDSATASETVVIEVLNLDPWNVDAGEDQNVVEGGIVYFSGSATDVAADTLTYTWNFGDSSSTVTGQTPNHSYEKNGVYMVTLTVTDEDGGSAIDTLTVNVYDYKISFDQGWNLISIPLVPENDDTSIDFVFDQIDEQVEKIWSYTYDATKEKNVWKFNKINVSDEWKSGSQNVLKIIPGYGYYVYMNTEATIYLNGKRSYGFDEANETGIPRPPTVNLATNSWNLIGKYGLEYQYIENALETLSTPYFGEYYDIMYDEEIVRAWALEKTEGYWLSMKYLEGTKSIEYKANYGDQFDDCYPSPYPGCGEPFDFP